MDKKRVPPQRLFAIPAGLAACAAVAFLLLWLNPNRCYVLDQKQVSQAEATKVCPFALITQEEFDLAAQALNHCAACFPPPGSVNPPARELSPGLVDANALRIDGQDVRVTAVTVLGLTVYVDYTNAAQEGGAPDRRCILTVSYDGAVSKTSTQYQDGEAVYIVENQGNETFALARQRRDLLYFLHH